MSDILRDPVCGMTVTYESAEARSEYNGQTYYFCSMDCKEQFEKDPERYIRNEKEVRR